MTPPPEGEDSRRFRRYKKYQKTDWRLTLAICNNSPLGGSAERMRGDGGQYQLNKI